MANENLTGQKFGKLTVVGFGYQDKRKQPHYECVCDCGKTAYVRGGNLKSGHNKSCGCLTWKNRLPPGEAARNSVFYDYQKRCKRDSINFELSKDRFTELTAGNCYYCGIQPSTLSAKRYKGDFLYNGIDRVDNTQGYTENNVVSCCETCNRAKRAQEVKEFLEWAKRLAIHQGWVE